MNATYPMRSSLTYDLNAESSRPVRQRCKVNLDFGGKEKSGNVDALEVAMVGFGVRNPRESAPQLDSAVLGGFFVRPRPRRGYITAGLSWRIR